MCLAMPLEVISIDRNLARVASGGMETVAALDLVDSVEIGDYVIVHAGYALQRLSAQEARETLAIWERLQGVDDE